jgi:serine protease inhibitor
MKDAIRTAASVLVLLLCVSGTGFTEEGTPMDPAKLVQEQNAFATDLYARLRYQGGNLFLSPHSIATALSMAFVGAGGDTAMEMAKVLHLVDSGSGNPDRPALLRNQVCEGYKAQLTLLNAEGKEGLSLHMANALWTGAGYPVKEGFIARIRNSFEGHMESLDFGNEPASRERINGWVADQTREKIKDLIGPGVLTPDTALVLTNAIYFKAAWDEQFVRIATRKEKFHVSAVKDVEAQMLNRTGYYKLAEGKGFRLLVIPYRDNEASMILLLPDRVDGLSEVEEALSAENLAVWLDESKSVRVALSLPKFKTTSRFDLNDPLTALGMKKAFTPGEAAFTGMAEVPGKPLYIGLVVHQAFVDVNEEGTEAAAATAVTLRAAAAPEPVMPVRFDADHPFVYIIRDNRTGAILFMGRLSDPSASGR